MNLSATVKSPADLTEEEVGAWKGFMTRQKAFSSPFYSPHYAQAVAQVRPGARVGVIRSGDEIVAFFPFQFSGPAERLLGTAEPIGGHMTDYSGVVPAPGFRISSRRLLELCGLNRFRFGRLEQSQIDLGLDGKTDKKGWIVDFSDGPEAYWKSIKKKDRDFVRKLAQRRKRLVDAYGPLMLTFDPINRRQEIERLVAYKREQYQRRGHRDPLKQRWTVDLLRLLASSSAKECAGMVSVLYAGDRWVASHFGLRNGGLLHSWFPVYDRELMAFGPGVLVRALLVDQGWKHGLRQIDTGCGDYHHKRKIGTEQNTYYDGVWYRGPASSFVLGPLAAVRRSLRTINVNLPQRRVRGSQSAT